MKGRWIIYSAAELAWLQANCTLPISAYHAAFQQEFARPEISAANLHSLRKRKGWRTGRTGRFAGGHATWNKGQHHAPPGSAKGHFQKGNVPANRKFIGHERIGKEGYVEISVDQPNPWTGHSRRYVQKHRYLWEQANGPLPAGMVLKSVDGDRTNTDPANWQAIPRALLPILNGGRHKQRPAYDDAAPEVRPAIMAVAKLKHRARTVRQGKPDNRQPEGAST